jgi:hypothetical protein
MFRWFVRSCLPERSDTTQRQAEGDLAGASCLSQWFSPRGAQMHVADLGAQTPVKKGDDATAATWTVSPESDSERQNQDGRNRFADGWIAATKRTEELAEKGEWEPILIVDELCDERCLDPILH